MKKIVCIEMPFFKRADPKQQHAAAVEMINQRVETDGWEVVNVETIFESGFLGFGLQQIGLRVWYRA